MRITGPVFAITSGVIVASTVITYFAGQTVVDLHRKEQQRRGAIIALDDLLMTMQDAETGQRGFIITGDQTYLGPFLSAENRVSENTARLGKMTRLGISQSDAAGLEKLVGEKMNELRQTTELRRQGNAPAALAIIETGAGKRAMDALRFQIAQLKDNQNRMLQKEVVTADRATLARTVIFVASGIINIMAMLWGYWRIRRAVLQRDTATADLQRQSDLLSTTLASIGDCVIVTDASGRITFMNRVAEITTGHFLPEARHRPIGEIFRIINEHTREAVEDPVEKVIREGVIVGLANHTLLIRKDGTEVPIDDSGAPIRTPNGALEGVVLVFRDFTKHKQTERELREAKQAAEFANQAKDKFLAMLSHELRTPLTPVLATLNLWQNNDQVPEALKPDVHMLRRNVILEARIIDDLLDLTRIARGVLSFTPEEVDVHDLINLLLDLIESEAREKRVELERDLKAERHFVNTDPGRLQQVLWNIVRNAINFTDAKGKVTVQTRSDHEDLQIIVSDTGIGMTRETLDRLFTPFEQADRNRSIRYGGLGLGMAISHALVQLMEGSLTAESKGLGTGSRFTITLAGSPEPAASSKLLRPRSAPPSKSRKILLVEDHIDTLVALARLLRNRGHEVQTASSIKSAIELIERNNFDVLLCDIGLPDGTGYDLVSQIRATQKTPAIALTGFGTSNDVERARKAGFDAHLTKPVDLNRLEATIQSLPG